MKFLLAVLTGLSVFLSTFPSEALGAPESCGNLCGHRRLGCSCQVTCKNLGDCCPDYEQYCVQISPYSGTLMGGTDFVIQHATFQQDRSSVKCRFNNETVTTGYVDDRGRAHCISPLLYETGRIPFEMSVDNGVTFPHSGVWLAVHHSKVSVQEKSILVNSKKWQYYGTPGYGGSLTLTWNSSHLTTESVDIELWGYREIGVPYSQSWEPEWRYLYTLKDVHPNNGTVTFVPKSANASFSSWEVGLLRIIPSHCSEGEENVPAVWSPVHALAWHLGEDFRSDPSSWAYDKCMVWHQAEISTLPNFLDEVADCPCTLNQSRTDTGRYHTDYGCDMEKGSVCTYHPGAVHCVRSIQSSPRYASGQQCCYDSSGAQVLTVDSLGGSTPDRGHDWGSSPYKKPPRVPSFSHWLYDVITFYYCCLWSDNCQYYLERRPSSNCRTYKPPRVASAFGDPHFLSFDGANLTFKGRGEYTLVSSSNLTIQARTQPMEHTVAIESENMYASSSKVSGLSAVVMQEGGSDVIEVRRAEITLDTEDLEVLLNQQVISFEKQSWMDLKGVFVYSAVRQNVTVMFPSGAGVEVWGTGEFLSISVLLPEKFLNDTQGLLGVMNGNPEDDFTFRNGTTLPSNASPEQLFELGADWAVTTETSLFTYDTSLLINTYKEKHDSTFIPVFSVVEDPNSPLTAQMRQLCGSDPFCRFDVLSTLSISSGNATKKAHQRHQKLVQSLHPVVSCGWLSAPENGTKEGTNYLYDQDIKFICNPGFILLGSPVRTCQSNGTWSGSVAQCMLAPPRSCAGQCGRSLTACSCSVTCENLGTCCEDYRHYCLQISPQSGILLGGREFVVLNVTFNKNSSVHCRFDYEVVTEGYIDSDGRAHCISPLLYKTGRIPFEMSVDGGLTYPHSGAWTSVHSGKVAESQKSLLVNETKWQYYGTPNTAGSLTIDWDEETFQATNVNIEVWGYQETGKPYSASWAAEWKYLYSMKKNHSNSGSFTFVPKPAPAPFSMFHVGSIRISPSNYSDGEWNIPAVWSIEHALAWHLGEDFRNDSATWARDKCLNWYDTEKNLPNFLNNIIDCPCTLAQSRADTGRFHADYGCDIENGSVCTYHPGAVHCVRGIQGSPDYAAGQQCCYDSSGFQVLTMDSLGGSTPDRGHDWGSPPYEKPPRVPGFSHWLYDVISFYYCCLWSDNCQYYLEHRPSSDCRTYKPPRVASAFGDPHFLTFDGANFTFKGKGEYTLVNSTYQNLMVQGRTQPATHKNNANSQVTGFSSIAMSEGGSDVIEVRRSNNTQGLEVLRNQEVISCSEVKWMDLEGVFVYVDIEQNVGKNVTVMFPSGAGVEVRERGEFLSVSVLLPEKFQNDTRGLLGIMNGNPEDDFSFRNGTDLPSNASSEQLFELGADWSVSNETSLFTYDSQFLIENYQVKHDSNFVPVFSVEEDDSDPLTELMHKLCESDPFCRFDVLTTKDLEVGYTTKLSHMSHQKLVGSLEPVVSCGWLSPPGNGKKIGTSYLEGHTVRFSCNQGYILATSSERRCLPNGTWAGEEAQCVSDNTLGIILGCVFAFLAVLTMMLVVILHEWRKARKQKSFEPTVAFHTQKKTKEIP